MQTYILAANLFSLTALLLGLNIFSRGRHILRLVPLFLLVISRSTILIIFLSVPFDTLSTTATSFVAALEVLSTACLIWALISPAAHLSELWEKLIWLGAGIAFFLVLFPLIPDWPIPYQIHSLIIVVFGAPLILVSLGRIGWIHLATLLILNVAIFLGLLELANVAGLVLLVAYGFFIVALQWDGMQNYQGRQKASEVLAQEAINQSQERQRLLEVGEIISAVPGLDEAMEHLTRSMAHITHSDQSGIFIIDVMEPDRARLAALYSPERPVNLGDLETVDLYLQACAPLQTILAKQPQQVVLANHSQSSFNQFIPRPDEFDPAQKSAFESDEVELMPALGASSLDELYEIWGENRIGPTVVQPLTVQGRSVGALVLGNPVTKQPIRESDLLLCRSLSSQLGTLVEAYRRYANLESQIEALVESEPVEAHTPVAVGLVDLTEGVEDRELVPVSPLGIGNDTRLARSPSHTGSVSENRGTTPQMQAALSEGEVGDKVDPNLQLDPDYLLAILETIEDAVVVSNAGGRVTMVNGAAERILGKSRQRLLGQPIGTLYGKIASGEPIENLAADFSRRNQPLPTYFEDDDRAIEGKLIPWRNSNSEWLGIIAVFRDVTHEIESDTARNSSIMALSRVMRDPLSIIKGYVELMLGGVIGEYSSEQANVQRIIHSSTEQMAEILDNALQISLQGKREFLPEFETLDVEEIISTVVYNVHSMMEISELELVQEIAPNLPPIVADRKQLSRILENLLSNANRFTAPGGRVTLRAWVQQAQSDQGTQPYLLLAIADNGVGIPRTEAKRIFDPFYQLGNQGSPDDQLGLGMGLAVVKELVELHNGRVWVESVPDEGSVFQVAIPLNN